MQEHLKFNILSFNWPELKPTFYFSLQDVEGSHRIHRSKFSKQILSAFPELNPKTTEYIYTTFTEHIEDGKDLQIEMYDEELRIYKQYLKNQIKTYFRSLGLIVVRNFVGDTQIWVPALKSKNVHYNLYYKFSLKIQFARVTKYPELVVSFDGTSKVLKKSVSEIEDSLLIKRCVYNQSTFNYQMKLDTEDKQDFYNSINFNETFPLFNLELAKALNIPLEVPVRANKYEKYIGAISAFAKKYLFTEGFKEVIPIYKEEFIDVPKARINHIDTQVGLLEFGKDNYGNKRTGLVPKKMMGRFKPFRRPPNQNIKFFFIHHESHQEAIRKLYDYLTKGFNQYYKGLESYINVKAEIAGKHFIKYQNLENPLPEIKAHLENLEFDDNVVYAAFYISPFDKFTPDLSDRLVYVKVKELLLNEGIVTQAIDYQNMAQNISNYQWHLNNISLALHAKLGGVPWKLAVTDKKELVIGVGAFTNQDEKRRYIASAFSFQNNGLFRKFEYFTQNETTLLAGSICKAIREFTSVAEADKVVIHFYKEMSYNELQPIRKGMNELGLKVPLYILNINKTEAEDIIAYDLKWDNKYMPKSGTYVRIGYNQFLLFNNARYNDSDRYSSAEGFPFPIKIKISSPDEDAFEDANVVLELLTQVYQFSRLYWKSLRQQNVPITIKYPEMVAQIAPRFENVVPEHAKDKLWFL